MSLITCQQLVAEDGSRLWLRLPLGQNAQISAPAYQASSPLSIAVDELRAGWKGGPIELRLVKDKSWGEEEYRLKKCEVNQEASNQSASQASSFLIEARSEIGLLYGAYALLRKQQCNSIEESVSRPAYSLRILNHWDNPDRTVERGYAGQSLWEWSALPDSLSPRYREYARANASIGINGTVLNNVNASPSVLTDSVLTKVKALADAFRPYGIRVYLSVNFASPMVLDGLSTADPLNKAVKRWWKEKVETIYRLIPDFGGFLVKANSEGQPGPCDFGRTHAEGANMLADALRPHGGIVMWRAFVYSPSDADRAKQAYLEFQPLDGQFRPNVLIQIKNGPIDFQPREPYSPLFTAMPKSRLMAEWQITQEYLGHSNHLAYLAPMWEEFIRLVKPTTLQGIAGVANIGTATNWCGHPFAAANWYAFGRLAWDPSLSSQAIAQEWAAQTFGTEQKIVENVTEMMGNSREAVVDYMMPLGLHHLFAWGHHYGPEPWCAIPGARPDWMPSYYHRADSLGIGFDRSTTGSHATLQYPDSIARQYDDILTCPEEYLLWFHHPSWSHVMHNGETLWESLCHHYDRGVRQVRQMQQQWEAVQPYVDEERFHDVQSRLKIQTRDAIWWKDACLLYFQTFSHLPFPQDIEPAIHELEDLQKVNLGISNFECPSKQLLNQWR
jgi:alpha-glucuronidase